MFLENKIIPHGFCFVKKDFLNKLPINKFANLKEVYFNYLGKKPYYEEDEHTFGKDEKFSFPKSINYKNIEVLSIVDGSLVNLSEIKNASSFDKLKVLILKNCVTGDYKNSRFLPSFQNLKHLEIDNKYSYKNIKENKIKEYEKIILDSKNEAKNYFNKARGQILKDIDKKRKTLKNPNE